jgi:hypothetical protein
MDDLINMIVDEETFERMLYHNDDIKFENYETFLEHNIKCLDEMTTDQIIWMRTLREMIKNKKIKLVDEESCVEFTAYGFYFNYKKNLCIINPR